MSVCRARRLDVVFSVPSAFGASAKRSLTAAPAGPLTLIRHQPLKFWPKSRTRTPGFGSPTFRTFRVWTARIGGAEWEASAQGGVSPRSAGDQSLSAKPGASQPTCSWRAS